MDTNHSHFVGSARHSLFRLLGFDVKVDISWVLLALLITWTLAAGVFPRTHPNLTYYVYWWMGITGAAGIFLSIVFHEFSHSLVARHFGMPIKGITLFIFGGVAEMEDEPPSPRSEFMMAIAGPLASYFLAGIFYLMARVGEVYQWHTAIIGVMAYLSYLNVIVATFNLIPAFPLDGGRMLRAVLWGWKKRIINATRVASLIGSGFAWLLMILGIIAFIQGNFIGGMWWFLIGLFLHSAATASYRRVVIRETLHGEPIRRLMTTAPITVPPSITIQHLVDDYVYVHHFKMFPVVDNDILLGCITTRDIRNIPRLEWKNHYVRDAIQSCSPNNTVSPESDTAKVLARMTSPMSSGRLMVVENGKLVGVITMKDLNTFISLKLDLQSFEP